MADTHTITQTAAGYRVTVSVDGRPHYLGTFASEADAVAVVATFVPVTHLPTNITYSYVRRRYMVYAIRQHRKHYVGCYTTLPAAEKALAVQLAKQEEPDIWERSREQIKRLSQHPYAVKRYRP